MKITPILAALLALAITTPATFAKNKKSKEAPDAAALITKYDTNADGKLDAQELSSLLAAEGGKKKKKNK